jgi:hypothetical protein
MAFNYSPRVITDGLVLYLDAANTRSYPSSGTAWTDLSRGGNNGTLTNGPTFNSGNGGSIQFDGVDDFILSSNPTSNIFSNLSSYTISFWLKETTYLGFGSVLLSSPGTNNLFLQITSTNAYIGVLGLSNNYLTLSISLSDLTLNKISNIVFVKNNNTAFFYLNTTQYTFPGTANFTFIGSDNSINIGKYTSSGFEFTGNLYSTNIYNRALSASEILQNYNATKTRFGL